MKRALCVTIILILLCLTSAGLFACAAEKRSKPAEEPSAPSILFLGDSIAEAVAGPVPLTEREAYGYYGIVGNINGFDYHNRAVSGATSSNLASYVKKEDDGLNMVKSLISTADIIHISILGNDFLNVNHTDLMLELESGDLTRIHSIADTAKSNLDKTLTHIRSLNPDATIIMQTLYNPGHPDNPLFTSPARRELTNRGVEPSEYHTLMARLIREINAVLTDYLEEHTVTDKAGNAVAPFELLDVYSAFERVYESNYDRWLAMICGDGIHPQNEGHAIIAGLLQEKLTELGYASPDALSRYKADKCAQVERLYSTLPTKRQVLDAIDIAEDFWAVNEAYFGGTFGALPVYTEMPVVQGTHFKETMRFSISSARVFDYGITTLLGEKSFIEFRADGTYELYLPTKSIVSGLIRDQISEAGSFDLDRFYPVRLLLPYVKHVTPTLEETDLVGLLDALKEMYGIEIDAIDFERESAQEVLRDLRERKKIVLTDPKIIKKSITFRFTGTYRTDTVRNPATGEKMTVIYVNNAVGRGESYVRYTMSEDEKGVKKVRMTIDVVKVELEGVLDA